GPGLGSEFTVRLPISSEASVEPTADEPSGPDAVPRLPRRRILVVDDNRSNATSLGVLLRALGQDVEMAYDGPAALELVRRRRPDLVLLDIGLPGMDGYEVARRCREDEGLRRIMLVAMTGYGKEEDRRRSQEAGFNAHLVKPVDLEDLEMLLTRPAPLGPGRCPRPSHRPAREWTAPNRPGRAPTDRRSAGPARDGGEAGRRIGRGTATIGPDHWNIGTIGIP